MQFTAEHEALRASVRDLVDREINPHVDEWERAGRFPAHALFPLLAKIGLLGLEYDPAYGGEGADHSFTVVAGEELGRIDCGGVPMGIAVQMAMATPSLHRYGSHELKERFLAPAIRGEVGCSIAVTEPDAGSNLAGLRTRAGRGGGCWPTTTSRTGSPSCQPSWTWCGTTTTPAPTPTCAGRTPRASPRSRSSPSGGCPARSPTPACSSTAASATWRRPGPRGSTGTAA